MLTQSIRRVMRETPETHEVHYLDMSGDGVPDAVEHIHRRRVGRAGSAREVVEETRRLAFGIGIDGVPAGIREETVVLALDGESIPVTAAH
jgi:hypothetical protein